MIGFVSKGNPKGRPQILGGSPKMGQQWCFWSPLTTKPKNGCGQQHKRPIWRFTGKKDPPNKKHHKRIQEGSRPKPPRGVRKKTSWGCRFSRVSRFCGFKGFGQPQLFDILRTLFFGSKYVKLHMFASKIMMHFREDNIRFAPSCRPNTSHCRKMLA